MKVTDLIQLLEQTDDMTAEELLTVLSRLDASAPKKLTYLGKHDGADIVKACEGRQMMFSYLDKQVVGKFWIEQGDRYALRLGDHSMLTGIDVYPELGLVTFASCLDIKNNY
jgi:hypothetical protein